MRIIVLYFLLTGLVSSQIKDSDGKIVSEIIFPKNSNVEAIPLLSGRDLLFIKTVRINGNIAGVFVIDTGSNVSMIDKSVADELQLSQDIKGLTVNDKRKYRFYKVNSLHLGRIELKNHLIYGGNISRNYFKFKEKVIGVIGGDILGKLPFAIDNKNLILKFFKREGFKPVGKEFPIEVINPMLNMGLFSKANSNSGTPSVSIMLNSKAKVNVLIDTAEEASVILRSKDSIDHKSLAGSYKLPPIFRKPGGSVDQYNALIKEVDAFGSKLPIKDRNFILFPRKGYVPLESQIGGRALGYFNLTFDYKNGKLWAEKFAGEKVIRGETDFAGHNELARSVRRGDLEKVRELLKAGAPRKFVGIRRESLLLLAIESDNPAVLDALLNKSGLDVNFPNNSGVTPIMRAAASNQVMMLMSLIEKKASLSAKDRDGMAAIHYAVMGGSRVITDLLIKNKANLNAGMSNGMRPLSLAAGEGSLGLFKALIDGGADISFLDHQGRSLLHLSAFGNNPELIKEILKNKKAPSIDAPDEKGFTALMIAVEYQRIKAVKKLIELGSSVKTMNAVDFTTALDIAYKTKNLALVKVVEDAWSVAK